MINTLSKDLNVHQEDFFNNTDLSALQNKLVLRDRLGRFKSNKRLPIQLSKNSDVFIPKKSHKYPLGSIVQVLLKESVSFDDVELKHYGIVDCIVVRQFYVLKNFPAYVISTIPVKWHKDYDAEEIQSYTYFCAINRGYLGDFHLENSLTQIYKDKVVKLHEHIQDYINFLSS
jgi:hypothetical protein